jgi:hypothetical protein
MLEDIPDEYLKEYKIDDLQDFRINKLMITCSCNILGDCEGSIFDLDEKISMKHKRGQ